MVIVPTMLTSLTGVDALVEHIEVLALGNLDRHVHFAILSDFADTDAVDAPGDAAWPITATTWAIMYKTPKDAAHTKTAFEFFKWSFENGQKDADSLDYVALPESLVKQIEAYWKSDFKS